MVKNAWKRTVALAALCVVSYCTGSSALAGDCADAAEIARRAAVDALFAEYTRPGAGVAVGIYRDGQPPYVRGYGLADLEHGVPMTPQSVIHIASTSKQFTAFAVALLASEGKVDLEADVHTYLPWLPDYGSRVTVSDLVHHTSGVKDQWSLLTLAGRDYRDVLKQEQILTLLARQRELDFEPGTWFEYSNSNYTLLGEIVRAVSGQTLREFTTQRMFQPLGMTRTFFYDDVNEIVPGRANSYDPSGDGGRWERAVLSYETVGATSLLTTAEDMVRWAANFAHPTVGDAALIRRLVAPSQLDDGTPVAYGFGLLRTRFGDHEALVHEGGDAAFSSLFAYYPKERFAVAILTNTTMDSPWKPVTAIANLYLDGGPAEPDDGGPPVVQPDPELLAAAAGTYLHPFRPTQTLTVKDGRLWLETVGDVPVPAVFRKDGTFDFGDRVWVRYRLRQNARGAVSAIEETRALRRPEIYLRVVPVQVPLERLAEYEGRYRSEDLDITYTLAVHSGQLTMRSIWSTAPVPLTPSVQDRFDTSNWSMRPVVFQRDAQGKIRGMLVHTSRARNLYFDRISDRERSRWDVADTPPAAPGGA